MKGVSEMRKGVLMMIFHIDVKMVLPNRMKEIV